MGRLMRYAQAEKQERIRLMEAADLPAKQTLAELGFARSVFFLPGHEVVSGPVNFFLCLIHGSA